MKQTTHFYSEGKSLTLKSVSKLHTHFNPWQILKITTESVVPFGSMSQGPDAKDAKPDRVIQLNCGDVCTPESYKTIRAWENFNNQGTKIMFLSDELWLTANNSKSFANVSESILRNNLRWFKHFEI